MDNQSSNNNIKALIKLIGINKKDTSNMNHGIYSCFEKLFIESFHEVGVYLDNELEVKKKNIIDSLQIVNLFAGVLITCIIQYQSYQRGDSYDSEASETYLQSHDMVLYQKEGIYFDKQKDGITCSMRALTNAFSYYKNKKLTPFFSYNNIIDIGKKLGLRNDLTSLYAEREEVVVYSFLKGILLVPVLFNKQSILEMIAFREILPRYLEKTESFFILKNNHYYSVCRYSDLNKRGFVVNYDGKKEKYWYILDSLYSNSVTKNETIGSTSSLMNVMKTDKELIQWLENKFFTHQGYDIYFRVMDLTLEKGDYSVPEKLLFNKYLSNFVLSGDKKNINMHPISLINFFVHFSELVSENWFPMDALKQYNKTPLPLPVEITNIDKENKWRIISTTRQTARLHEVNTSEKDRQIIWRRVGIVTSARRTCLLLYDYMEVALKETMSHTRILDVFLNWDSVQKKVFQTLFTKNMFLFTSLIDCGDSSDKTVVEYFKKPALFILSCSIISVLVNQQKEMTLDFYRFVLNVFVLLLSGSEKFYESIESDDGVFWFWGVLNKIVDDQYRKDAFLSLFLMEKITILKTFIRVNFNPWSNGYIAKALTNRKLKVKYLIYNRQTPLEYSEEEVIFRNCYGKGILDKIEDFLYDSKNTNIQNKKN